MHSNQTGMPDEASKSNAPNHDATPVRRDYEFVVPVDALLKLLSARSFRLKMGAPPNTDVSEDIAPRAVRKSRKTRKTVTPSLVTAVFRQRRQHGGTLAEIAAAVDCSPSTVSNILNGKYGKQR